MAKKIYISGKITGLTTEEIKSRFGNAELAIEIAGDEPVNPLKVAPYDPAHTWEHYMVEDIRALLGCNAILMLSNWQDSKGARIEHAIAKEMGLEIFYDKNHKY